MGRNNSKRNNWQRINLQNIQAAQFQKNKWPNQKMGQSRNVCSPKKTYRWLINTGKDVQHYSLSEKCKPKPQWRYHLRPVRMVAIKMSTAAAAAKLLQSCPILCDPIDGSPSGSPIPGILQARVLEWGAISFSSAWKWKVKVKSLSRVRLSDPMDCSPPGSSIHGIFQARVLE